MTSQNIRNSARAALVFSALMLLAACDSDSSGTDIAGNNPGDNTDPPVRVATLEYFLDFDSGLTAVAPSQPNAPMTVDSDIDASSRAYYTFGVTPLIAAQSATPTSANGLHVASVLYPRRDGTLWRAGTDPDVLPPTPVRVSSAGHFDRICMRGAPEPAVYADAGATPFVYVLAQTGTSCEDALDAGTATWHVVLAGDDDSTAPRDFPSPDPLRGNFAYGVQTKAGTVINLQDSSGDNAGWLIRRNGMLTRVGPNGTITAADIAAIADDFDAVVPQLSSGVLLLDVDSALTAFDPADNSIKDLGFALDTSRIQIASDREEAFITKRNTLYRTTGGGSDVVKIDVDPNDPGGTSRGSRTTPLVGSDRVVWLADARAGEQALRSVDKSATAVGSGQQIAGFEGDVLWVFDAHTDQWLFYGEAGDVTASPVPVTAVALRMDGTAKKEFADSTWVGFTQDSRTETGSGASATRIYRVPDVGGQSGLRDGLAGKRLLSMAADDSANPAATVEIGVIPSDSERIEGPFVSPGFGSGRLLTRLIAGAQTDILFFQDDQAGSLQRVTDDDEDQLALPGF